MVRVVLIRGVWTHAADAVTVGKDGKRDVFSFGARRVRTAGVLVGGICEGTWGSFATLSVDVGRVRYRHVGPCIAVGNQTATPVVECPGWAGLKLTGWAVWATAVGCAFMAVSRSRGHNTCKMCVVAGLTSVEIAAAINTLLASCPSASGTTLLPVARVMEGYSGRRGLFY